MAFEDYKKCPVDGTRFFHRSATYPHGRPAGARYCSGSCAAMAHSKDEPRDAKSVGAFYTPDVDGTLGSRDEQANGGPQLNAFGELARGGMADLYKGQLV